MSGTKFTVGAFFTRRSHASREQVAGIFRFVSEHPDWELHVFERPEDGSGLPEIVKTFRPDGILTGHPDVLTAFCHSRRPRPPSVLVDFIDARPQKGVSATLVLDERQIGVTAADYFLARGFVNFAFAGIAGSGEGDTPVRLSKLQEEGFRARLAEAGHQVVSYHEQLVRHVRHYSDLDALAGFLDSLPKPCAVFATADMIAQSVVFAARRVGIAIPERLAIIGVDNDTTVCENTHPTLSSVAPDYIGAGYRAAATLDELMRGGVPDETAITYGNLGVVGRMSTQNVSGTHRRLAFARELIRTQSFKGIRVREIAEEIGISPRMLEITFQRAFGRSIREEIVSVRLAEARRLLLTTKKPLHEIATLSGFHTFAALRSLFERRFGMSMLAYRKQSLRP